MIRDYLDTLTTERNRAWSAQKELLDRLAAEKREASSEEDDSLKRMDADLDRLDGEIKTWLGREQRENEAAIARAECEKIVRPEVAATAERNEQDRLRAFLRGEVKKLEIDLATVANHKRAIRGGARGVEFRDLTVGTTTAGGHTVPTLLAQQLYDFLEVYSGMRRTNATIITTSHGDPMNFPKVTAHGTAAIVGEGTALAEADPAFGQTAIPVYKYGQLLQISSELIEDSAVDITGFIAKDMARALARVTDAAYVSGSGTNQPTGVNTVAGTAVTGLGTNATTIAAEDLIDTVYAVNEEYRLNGAQWLMRDATIGKVRKIREASNGAFIWQPSLVPGAPDMLLGYPIVSDPNMPAQGASANSILFGDFSPFYIRDARQIEMAQSGDYAFANDLMTYRATMRTGSNLVDLTGAVLKYRGGTA